MNLALGSYSSCINSLESPSWGLLKDVMMKGYSNNNAVDIQYAQYQFLSLIDALATTIFKIKDHLFEHEKSNLIGSARRVNKILTPEAGNIGMATFGLGMVQQHFQKEIISLLDQ